MAATATAETNNHNLGDWNMLPDKQLCSGDVADVLISVESQHNKGDVGEDKSISYKLSTQEFACVN